MANTQRSWFCQRIFWFYESIFFFYLNGIFEFFRGLKISGKIFSRRYELSRDSRESILGVFVCKFILLVFSGGDSLLFLFSSVPVFMGSEQEAGGSLSPELAVVLDAQKNAILTAVNAQIQGLQTTEFASSVVRFSRSNSVRPPT